MTNYRNANQTAICVNNTTVTTSFEKKGKITRYAILNNINFSLKEKTIVALMGSNGSGKTTLLNILAGLLKPQDGTISIYGHSPGGIFSNQIVSLVTCGESFIPELTVNENLQYRGILGGLTMQKCLQSIEYYSRRLNLLHLMLRKPDELSVGERQRLIFCAALLKNPSILLLDEFTANMDVDSTTTVYNTLEECRQNGMLAIVATHNKFEVSTICTEVLFLSNNVCAHIPVNQLQQYLPNAFVHGAIPARHSTNSVNICG